MDDIQDRFFSSIIKGVLFAVIVSLMSVLIFAFIVQIANLQSGVIKAVNQFIKIISVFLSCMFFVNKKAGLIRGAIIGVFFTLITYLIFALFFSQIDFGFSFFVDIIFMLVIGGLAGIISVNLKR